MFKIVWVFNWILKSLPTFLKLKHFCYFLKSDMVTEWLFNSILLFTPNLQDAKDFLWAREAPSDAWAGVKYSYEKNQIRNASHQSFSESLLLGIWEILVKDQFSDLGFHGS